MLFGLTTVIAAFFLFCLAKQEMIKNKTYYYLTFACLVGIVIFETLFNVFGPTDTYGRGFCAIVSGVLHVAALLLTMGYVGGVTIRSMAGEMKDAVDDFRAGGDAAKKPVIIPLSGQQPTPRTERSERVDRDTLDAERPRIVIDLPKRNDDGKQSIPVE